jgi:hypothetical protein
MLLSFNKWMPFLEQCTNAAAAFNFMVSSGWSNKDSSLFESSDVASKRIASKIKIWSFLLASSK